MSKSIETAEIDNIKTYKIASCWRIFFARAIDFVLSSIIPLIIINLISIKVDSWSLLGINIGASFFCYFCYFIILPWLFYGNTIGKIIFNIRLRGIDKMPTKLQIFSREMMYLILPWSITVLGQVIAIVVMNELFPHDDSTQTNGFILAQLIVNISQLVYILFLTFIGIVVIFSEYHQTELDRKFNLFCVERVPLEDRISYTSVADLPVDETTKNHVHLKDIHPGYLSNEVLAELENLPQNLTLKDDDNLNKEQEND